MSEVIWIRGSGGGVWKMTLPLQPAIARQLADKQVTRVNEDGSDWTGPDEAPAQKPARRAPAKAKQ